MAFNVKDGCTKCGRNDIVTESNDEPRCSRHDDTLRRYEVEVIIPVRVAGDDEAAWSQVYDLLRASGVQFTMLEDIVRDVTDEEA